jgi:hypothetical protein
MKVEVNITKRYVIGFIFILAVFGGLFFAYAYDSNPANPSAFGHTPSETGPGSNQNWGGSSTYSGGSSSKYYYPGQLAIGGSSTGWPSGSELFVSDADASGDAGVGISSGASGRAYIDFYSVSASPKANIAWDASTNSLNVNALAGSKNTILNLFSGSVGIGKTPVAPPSSSGHTAVLDVYGAVCLNGVCKGDGTSAGVWGRTMDQSANVVQLTAGSGGTGYQEVTSTIGPYGQGYVAITGSSSFCALSQVDVSGSGLTSTPGAGCYVTISSGSWVLKAYRNNINQGVVCRAICMHND